VRRAAREHPPFQLAISLHTADDEQRDELVPAMRGTPIEDVLAAGDDWFSVTHREPTYEYVLLGGVNDSAGHAERLAKRLARRRCTVNLIPYNPTEEIPYDRPEPAAVEAFRARLTGAGIVATVRWSRGVDGAAACGQLRMRGGGESGGPLARAAPQQSRSPDEA
jgi:23S rRNA (adenine2503-C2)-methyltransferase